MKGLEFMSNMYRRSIAINEIFLRQQWRSILLGWLNGVHLKLACFSGKCLFDLPGSTFFKLFFFLLFLSFAFLGLNCCWILIIRRLKMVTRRQWLRQKHLRKESSLFLVLCFYRMGEKLHMFGHRLVWRRKRMSIWLFRDWEMRYWMHELEWSWRRWFRSSTSSRYLLVFLRLGCLLPTFHPWPPVSESVK